ncbi:hypothetical protein LguiA_011754 [Lonicera macranthoides]
MQKEKGGRHRQIDREPIIGLTWSPLFSGIHIQLCKRYFIYLLSVILTDGTSVGVLLVFKIKRDL